MSDQQELLPSEQEAKVTEALEALEASKRVADVNTPEDMAAAFFTLSEPKFDGLTSNMSNRELRRVIKKAVLFPFNKKEIKLLSKQEEDACYLLSEMIMHKMIMQLHYETLKVEQAQKRIDEAKLEEKQEEVKNE